MITYVYLLFVVAAVICCLLSARRDMSMPLRFFAVLLALTVCVELIANGLKNNGVNNYFVYNWFVLPEFWMYGYFFLKIIHRRFQKRIIYTFLILFPLFWAKSMWVAQLLPHWNAYVLLTGCFFTVVFAVMYGYQAVTDLQILQLRRHPEFWITAGLLIFYSACLPFFGGLNYLNTHSPDAALVLAYVMEGLNMVMYACFSYAFLCRIINTTTS